MLGGVSLAGRWWPAYRCINCKKKKKKKKKKKPCQSWTSSDKTLDPRMFTCLTWFRSESSSTSMFRVWEKGMLLEESAHSLRCLQQCWCDMSWSLAHCLIIIIFVATKYIFLSMHTISSGEMMRKKHEYIDQRIPVIYTRVCLYTV